jgi:iron complex outermembrane receptor protein
VRITIASTFACLSLVNSAAAKEAKCAGRQAIQVPAKPLGSALQTLARDCDLQIVYISEDVDPFHTDGVTGELTLDEALTKLLAGTGLTFSHTGDHGLVIKPSARPQLAESARPPAGAGQSPPATVNATHTAASEAEISSGEKKPRTRGGWFGALLGMAAAHLFAPLAAAQSADSSAEAAVLEEVVVTAMKRETVLQDTPVALTVLDGDTLQDAGIQSINDLQNIAPSVQINASPFGSVINIRGVTTTDNTSKGDQGIAFNVDGITVGRPRESGAAFFDVNRIEVLRGPQGTLYGKSTTGGVINVISNRPTSEAGGRLNLEYGDFETKRLSGVYNAPVTDKFAVRAAFDYNERDGYLPTHNGSAAFNDQDDRALRLSGLYQFTDTTSLYLTTSLGKIAGIGAGQVPVSRFVAAGTSVNANDIVKVKSASGESGRSVFGVPAAIAPQLDEKYDNVTLEFKTQFSGAQLTYVGGHRNYKSDSFSAQSLQPSALAGPPPPVFAWDWANYNGDAVTNQHELRLSNAESGRLNWIAGYNWYREDLSESDHNWSAPVVNPTRVASIPGIDPLNTTDHVSSGFFGQATFALVERLNLTLGARRSKDEVVRRGTFAVGPGQVDAAGRPCVYPNDCIGGPNNGTQSAGKTTWRAGLDFKPGDNSLLYFSAATGYKAGGFNDFDPATGTFGPYDPEELTAYEAGFKATLRHRLTVDSALFFYDYSAAQISSLTNVQGNVIILTRLAPVTIKGWENDFTWLPTDDDTLRFGFSLMKGEYDQLTAGGRAAGAFPPIGAEFTDWSGRSIDKVSDVTVRAEYLHDFNLASGARITARIASRYDSGYMVSNVTNAYQFEQDAFTRTDFNLTYRGRDDRFSIGVFVRNIENKVQILNAPDDPYTAATQDQVGVGVTEPRVYGLRTGMKF